MKKRLCAMVCALVGSALVAGAEEAQKPGNPLGDRPHPPAQLDPDTKLAVAHFLAQSADRAKARFDHIDADQDGKVTEAELDKARERMANRPGGEDRPRPEFPVFKEVDADGDGAITFAEYSAFALARAKARAAELDKNGDGILSKDEMPWGGGGRGGRERRQGPPPGEAPPAP